MPLATNRLNTPPTSSAPSLTPTNKTTHSFNPPLKGTSTQNLETKYLSSIPDRRSAKNWRTNASGKSRNSKDFMKNDNNT
jgi:hypothetical protein